MVKYKCKQNYLCQKHNLHVDHISFTLETKEFWIAREKAPYCLKGSQNNKEAGLGSVLVQKFFSCCSGKTGKDLKNRAHHTFYATRKEVRYCSAASNRMCKLKQTMRFSALKQGTQSLPKLTHGRVVTQFCITVTQESSPDMFTILRLVQH